MNSEFVEIAFQIGCVFLIGFVVFIGSRWLRKKNDVIGNLATVPFVVATLIGAFMVFIYVFN